MTEDDKDLLKRLLDDELLSLKTVEETGNRLKELIAENERLREEKDRLVTFINTLLENYDLEYEGIVLQ
jgi:hypothetical protein